MLSRASLAISIAFASSSSSSGLKLSSVITAVPDALCTAGAGSRSAARLSVSADFSAPYAPSAIALACIRIALSSSFSSSSAFASGAISVSFISSLKAGSAAPKISAVSASEFTSPEALGALTASGFAFVNETPATGASGASTFTSSPFLTALFITSRHSVICFLPIAL